MYDFIQAAILSDTCGTTAGGSWHFVEGRWASCALEEARNFPEALSNSAGFLGGNLSRINICIARYIYTQPYIWYMNITWRTCSREQSTIYFRLFLDLGIRYKFNFNKFQLAIHRKSSKEISARFFHASEKFARSTERCEIHNALWLSEGLERSSAVEQRGILLVHTFGNWSRDFPPVSRVSSPCYYPSRKWSVLPRSNGINPRRRTPKDQGGFLTLNLISDPSCRLIFFSYDK